MTRLEPAVKGERKLFDLAQPSPKFVYDDCTVRQAADHMVNHGIGRLPVVRRDRPQEAIGMITRSDVLSAFQHRVRETHLQRPTIKLRWRGLGGGSGNPK